VRPHQHRRRSLRIESHVRNLFHDWLLSFAALAGRGVIRDCGGTDHLSRIDTTRADAAVGSPHSRPDARAPATCSARPPPGTPATSPSVLSPRSWTRSRRPIHIILDNLSTQKTEKDRRFSLRIPTCGCTSWRPIRPPLNQVELWFAMADRNVPARGAFTWVAALNETSCATSARYNDAKPICGPTPVFKSQPQATGHCSSDYIIERSLSGLTTSGRYVVRDLAKLAAFQTPVTWLRPCHQLTASGGPCRRIPRGRAARPALIRPCRVRLRSWNFSRLAAPEGRDRTPVAAAERAAVPLCTRSRFPDLEVL
jgi:hypothetical protein